MSGKPDYANMPKSEPHWNSAGRIHARVEGKEKYSDIEIEPIMGFTADGHPEYGSPRKVRMFAPWEEMTVGSIICGCATFQLNGKYVNVTMGACFRRDGAAWIRLPSATGKAHEAAEPKKPEPWPADERATISGAPAASQSTRQTPTTDLNLPLKVRKQAVAVLLDMTNELTNQYCSRHGLVLPEGPWVELFKYVGMCLKIDADAWNDALKIAQEQSAEPTEKTREAVEYGGDLGPDSDIPF